MMNKVLLGIETIFFIVFRYIQVYMMMSAVDQTKICVICKNQNEDAIFSQLTLKGVNR